MARNYIFAFPGDPRFPAELLSIEEFLEKYPREPILIRNMKTGETQVLQEMAHDEIRCDSCNQRPEKEVLVIRGSRAYCEDCTKHKMQYLEEYK